MKNNLYAITEEEHTEYGYLKHCFEKFGEEFRAIIDKKYPGVSYEEIKEWIKKQEQETPVEIK